MPGEHVILVNIQMSNFTDRKSQKKLHIVCYSILVKKDTRCAYLFTLMTALKVKEATHMSVFLHVMKGPYDDHLSWPLEGGFEANL